ncbi:MAG: DUF4038 domain-containing protein [Planctomycetota bacterium]
MGAQPRQWKVTELEFGAAGDYGRPFQQVQMTATFAGPGGKSVVLPGFYDGNAMWKVRFTPTRAGRWTWATVCEPPDRGLHGCRGEFEVLPGTGDNPLHAHGGFLKPGANRRHLTYSDGTPFFYLADTWWAAPSAGVPFQNFRQCVDTRVAQGYTAFQMHGHRPLHEGGPGAFEAVQKATPESIAYWREVDRYYDYAASQGLLAVTGFFAGWSFDTYDYENHLRLWSYYLARYGAYPITFLVTQEYNQKAGDRKEKDYDERYLDLARFIKEHDPYQRAMTIHPWALGVDNAKARDEPWCDFIMVQGGHWTSVDPQVYYDLYSRTPAKPFLESECNYEGFQKGGFAADAACIRHTAYNAVQCGSCGFGYGAQGLYGGVLSKEDPGPTARWGPVLTWDEGLALPGGAQLQHMRACYESVPWWNMTPRPHAAPERSDVLVRAEDRGVCLVYFPPGLAPDGVVSLSDDSWVPETSETTWFNPRSGERRRTGRWHRGQPLPERPDSQDWMLVLTR